MDKTEKQWDAWRKCKHDKHTYGIAGHRHSADAQTPTPAKEGKMETKELDNVISDQQIEMEQLEDFALMQEIIERIQNRPKELALKNEKLQQHALFIGLRTDTHTLVASVGTPNAMSHLLPKLQEGVETLITKLLPHMLRHVLGSAKGRESLRKKL